MTVYEPVWVAPESFEDFYRTHRAYVWSIAKERGIPRQDLNATVSEVFARILEIDMLSTYDPQRAPFSQWIGHYTNLKIQGLRDMLRSRRREIPFGLDLEYLLPPAGDDWTEVVETVVDLHAAAGQLRYSDPVLYATWQAVQECVRRTGELAIRDLADIIGASPSGAFQRLWRFREIACAVAGVPIPPRRAHTTHGSARSGEDEGAEGGPGAAVRGAGSC